MQMRFVGCCIESRMQQGRRHLRDGGAASNGGTDEDEEIWESERAENRKLSELELLLYFGFCMCFCFL